MVNYTSRKGQIFSFDFLVATSIFLLAIGVLFSYWTYTNIQIQETMQKNQLIDKSYKASDVWYREGLPIYWNSSDVVELGLQNDNRFNQTKMNTMKTEIGYDKTKVMTGLSGYEYNFTVIDSDNTTVFSFGKVPLDPTNLVRINRIGIYESSIVELRVLVWI